MGDVQHTLQNLEGALLQLLRSNGNGPSWGAIKDFRAQRDEVARKQCISALQVLETQGAVQDTIPKLRSLIKDKELEEAILLVRDLQSGLPKQATATQSTIFNVKTSGLPPEISAEVQADIEEAKRCFEAHCLRSSIILCGRIMETVLHRKYYEITGNDLLETSPGIGIGKLIAKLKEAQVELPIGLTEQIHLINHVRISSVHRKTTLFLPTKEQTQAIVLYTLDVVRSIFS